MAEHLTAVLKVRNNCNKFQSGFWKGHSTRTALLRLSNDIVMSSDDRLLC